MEKENSNFLGVAIGNFGGEKVIIENMTFVHGESSNLNSNGKLVNDGQVVSPFTMDQADACVDGPSQLQNGPHTQVFASKKAHLFSPIMNSIRAAHLLLS